MAEDLNLPKLVSNPAAESLPKNGPRKRVRLSSPQMSSDPAIFSSDDDPSADNYTQGRRKQIYRGPWYKQQPASDHDSQESRGSEFRKKSKRTFERQFDSGVWLGSDGTDVDEATEGLQAINETWNLPVRPLRAKQTRNEPPSPEALARGQIELCLEGGNETIDLSSRGLTSISNSTIRPLAAFSCIPPVTEGVFSRIEPILKLFLASNSLTTLPVELFNLDRLTVLSLRANRIHELPPGIGNLSNLQELNISMNKMQYLPFEILNLFSEKFRLQTFTIHPNHFHEPRYLDQESNNCIEEEASYKIGLGRSARPRRGAYCWVSQDERCRSWHPQWKISYKARTEVRFLDLNGTHLKGPTFSNQTLFGPRKFPNGLPVAEVGDKPSPPIPRGNNLSRAPSLLEVALTACSRTPQLPYLQSMLPEPCPEYFPELLTTVAAKKESGSTKCTICKREFIIQRTEWIEWWEITKITDKGMASAASPLRQMENERDVLERMVPLMRRGCSWLCVPEKVMLKDEDQMVVDA